MVRRTILFLYPQLFWIHDVHNSGPDSARLSIEISVGSIRVLLGPHQLAHLLDIFSALGSSSAQLAALTEILVPSWIHGIIIFIRLTALNS
jgi:hypothetical protein